MFSILLILSFVSIFRNKTPVPQYTRLNYCKTHWLLDDIHDRTTRFERAYISLDAGLFILLTLVNEKKKAKKLVIFVDQMSSTQYRMLNIIGKITSKK